MSRKQTTDLIFWIWEHEGKKCKGLERKEKLAAIIVTPKLTGLFGKKQDQAKEKNAGRKSLISPMCD